MPDPNVVITLENPTPPIDPAHDHPMMNATSYSTPALSGEGEFVNECSKNADVFWQVQIPGGASGMATCTPPGKGSSGNIAFFTWTNLSSGQAIWVGAAWQGEFASAAAYFAAHPVGQGGHHSSPIIIS